MEAESLSYTDNNDDADDDNDVDDVIMYEHNDQVAGSKSYYVCGVRACAICAAGKKTLKHALRAFPVV